MKPIKYSIQVFVPMSKVWTGYNEENGKQLKEASKDLQYLSKNLVETKVDHFLQVALVPHGWKLVKE